ncbi:MAG: ATPase [Marinilabiliales bacterium]|nr:MAG: ATPase [Marinilabiliales bacterium]
MEENINNRIKRVVLIGAESTGKTELAEFLARQFKTATVPEYARGYIEQLDRKYTYEDVLHIANKQLELETIFSKNANHILFYDTYLIIIKIWLKLVFNKLPDWIDKRIRNSSIDLFLLCNNDIPWISDPVRENGGVMRDKLFEMYKEELIHYGLNYKIVDGQGELRYKKAHQIVKDFFKQN